MTLLVSACLLGCPCRYDGKSRPAPQVLALMDRHALIPVCPEQLGGLPTPRPPAERRNGGVFTQTGDDLTQNYLRGAQTVLQLAQLYRCDGAILKERSPACGNEQIYDGTFTRSLTAGRGVAAQLLLENGVSVWGESQLIGL